MSRERSADFARLLDFLKASRGFDFTGYKLSTLMRRVQKRMGDVGVEGYNEYTDYLQVHPDEFYPLFNTILINVTGFFRDPEAWDYLRDEILPRIVEDRAPDRSIRVWSAGCAGGPEAYTIAMLLAAALGEEAFRDRVKIYATDADDEALTAARSGSFAEREVEGVPPELLERFFDRINGRFQFHNDLRRCIIFGRHDLVQDAAISRVDLLICRNTLMYFNAETQSKILARFHFALNRSGYLFLGRAETLLTHGGSFKPVDLKRRVFQRTPTSNLRDRLLALAQPANQEKAEDGARLRRLRDAAHDLGPVAQLVVDAKGHLVAASDKARRLFNLAPDDLGRLLQDLQVSYRPFELRSAIEEAERERVSVRVPEVAWISPRGEAYHLEAQVTPVTGEDGNFLGAAIYFLDHTHANQLKNEVERAHQELETAYEELQSANEELETTNEELQSTVEELETTNEELQSANEELETMNEELQSTNEELRTMNDQLHQRSDELLDVNRFLESVLANLRAAVVVLNPQLEVEVWSERATDLWGLRADEAQGRPFLGLDIGLPIGELDGVIRDTLAHDGDPRQLRLEGVNRKGQPIWCQVTCSRFLVGDGGDSQVLLLMEDARRE